MKNRNSFFKVSSFYRVLFGVLLLSILATGAFAQVRIAQYTVSTPTLTFTSISSTGTNLTTSATGYGYRGITPSFSLPFAFPFDGSTVASGSLVYLSEGGLGFGTTMSYGNTNGGVGSASFPERLSPYSAIYTSMGAGTNNGASRNEANAGIWYQVTGTQPNRVLTVQMNGIHSPGSGPNYQSSATSENTQIKLYETTGVIQFIYSSHNYQLNYEGYSSGIGINGFTSPSFSSLTYATGTSGTPSTDLQFSFAPPQEFSLVPNPPSVPWSPKTLNFGTTTPQNPITLTATAKSVGSTGTTIHILSYGLTGSSAYSITSAPAIGTAIASGSSVSFSIKFLPLVNGNLSGSLTVTTDGTDSAVQTIVLNGIGAVPEVSYSSTNMFRGVNTEVTDTSGTQYLYINSIGGGPLVVNSVSFIGLDGGKAYVVTHLPSHSISPGGVDSIGVKFTPDLEGEPDAHMVINTTAVNIPWDTVSMFGVGILPHLTIDSGKSYPLPLTVNFDSVKLGSDSTILVQLWNSGSDTIAIEKNYYESSDFDFSIVPVSGADTLIPPGGTQNIAITFTPLQQGHREAEIRIRTNIPHTETTPAQDTSSFIINVEGTGVPSGKLSITGPSTNGNVSVGKSGCVTDTLWNTGAASITVNSLAISGTNASDFTVSGFTSGLVIGANSYATFQLCADPSMMGAATGLLTATGTSSETPAVATLNLAVFGTLIADTGIIKQSFMSQSCGLDTELISVANTGNVTDTFVANPLVGTNSGDFSVTPSTPQIEAGGDTAKYIVIFSGANAGENASLLVTGGAAPLSFPLAASAGAATIAGTQAAPMTAIGATSAQFTVTVNNTGGCPWTSGLPTVDPQFTYVSGAGTIAGNSSAPFTFTYTPTTETPSSYPVTFTNATGATTGPPAVTITTATDAVAPTASSNGYSLEQNYPNPFNGTSQLTMTLPVGALVHLSIIDVQGQVVETLLNQHYDAGSFSVTMDASQLASGTYYYQMNANGVTLTRQMVVVK